MTSYTSTLTLTLTPRQAKALRIGAKLAAQLGAQIPAIVSSERDEALMRLRLTANEATQLGEGLKQVRLMVMNLQTTLLSSFEDNSESVAQDLTTVLLALETKLAAANVRR